MKASQRSLPSTGRQVLKGRTRTRHLPFFSLVLGGGSETETQRNPQAGHQGGGKAGYRADAWLLIPLRVTQRHPSHTLGEPLQDYMVTKVECSLLRRMMGNAIRSDAAFKACGFVNCHQQPEIVSKQRPRAHLFLKDLSVNKKEFSPGFRETPSLF